MTYLTVAYACIFLAVFLLLMIPLVIKLDRLDFARRMGMASSGVIKNTDFKTEIVGKALRLLGAEYYEKVKGALMKSEMENKSPESVIFLSMVLAMTCAFLGAIAASIYMKELWIPGLIVGGLVGFRFPMVQLESKIKKRKDNINSSLIECIELLSTACVAGMEIDQAIKKIADISDSTLAAELKRTWSEMNKQKTMEQAIGDMVARCDSMDVENMMLSIQQGIETGSPISGILKEQGASIRSNVKARIIREGEQAKVKAVFPMVLFLLPAFMLMVFTPAVITFLQAMNEI